MAISAKQQHQQQQRTLSVTLNVKVFNTIFFFLLHRVSECHVRPCDTNIHLPPLAVVQTKLNEQNE